MKERERKEAEEDERKREKRETYLLTAVRRARKYSFRLLAAV